LIEGAKVAIQFFSPVLPAEADDSDVKYELARINKLDPQARSRLEKVKEYCALIRDRLDQLTFEQPTRGLEVLLAEFTLERDGQLRIFFSTSVT
jgi:hypothetical protein